MALRLWHVWMNCSVVVVAPTLLSLFSFSLKVLDIPKKVKLGVNMVFLSVIGIVDFFHIAPFLSLCCFIVASFILRYWYSSYILQYAYQNTYTTSFVNISYSVILLMPEFMESWMHHITKFGTKQNR